MRFLLSLWWSKVWITLRLKTQRVNTFNRAPRRKQRGSLSAFRSNGYRAGGLESADEESAAWLLSIPALLSPHFLDRVNRRMIASPPSVVSLVYLVHLVHLVHLVCLVYLVCFVA
jgi:hypothetical protein